MTRRVSLDVGNLRRLYLGGALTPSELVDELHLQAGDDPHHAWITRLSPATLQGYARELEGLDPESLPLYGIPFAVGDDIDLAAVPTTAGCAGFAQTPKRSASVVQRLIDAGAIPLGKTNLDPFAFGLDGTRSSYGASRNAFDPAFAAGGSNGGAAVAVALGQASFALATDTIGDARVPAALNNVVALKPTRGLLSAAGLLPGCRSLESVSIVAMTADDAREVLQVTAGFDPLDPFSARPVIARTRCPQSFRFGLPARSQAQFFGDAGCEASFAATVAQLIALGGLPVEIDFEPFLEAGRLVREGPWLAERHVTLREFATTRSNVLDVVTRRIVERGREFSAVDAFAAKHRLAALRRQVEAQLQGVDLVVTPTVGAHSRIEEAAADPLRTEARLGYYTAGTNVLELAAVGVPAGFTPEGLPFGVTLVADAWSDQLLLDLAGRLQRALSLPLGATGFALPQHETPATLPPGHVTVAVAGAHMTGLSSNRQLTERGAFLLGQARTAPVYRFYALPGGPPYRAGLVRAEHGAPIAVELWAVPLPAYGSFVAGIPRPFAIAGVELDDGTAVQGVTCEPHAVRSARDVTSFGGWRAFLASVAAA